MSLIEESYLQHLLRECDAYSGRQEKEAKVAVSDLLGKIYTILTRNIKQTFQQFSLETIVHFMELTVEIEKEFKKAEEFVNYFFQRVTTPSQFYIRALFVKAKFIAYEAHNNEEKGEAMVHILKESIQQISKALDLIVGPTDVPKGKDSKGGTDSNKAKYSFLVFNASTCLYKITRFMLRQHWQKNFTEIYERIYKLFEELDEPDQNWRCQFTLILFQCLYDNDKKPDAFKILDLLWERAKSKNCDSLDSLFRLRVHLSKENGALSNIIKKDIEGPDPNGWKILEILQRMRSGAIPEAQVEKQLMGVVNQISLGVLSSNEQNASVTLSPIMQERLGEAGRIALKFNIVNIAQSITTFLGKARQPNQKAIVLNEYNKAELMIKRKTEFVDKKTGMMLSTSQIKELEIESRKQAIRVLEKVMIINKKLANPDLIYEGAVLIWNTSLPFMCPQYRANIAKALDISVQLLEQIDSVDHDLRTKMHLELAKTYFGNEQMFPEVERNILSAIKLDHSIPISKLQFKFEPEEDPSLYHRPYMRYLESFREKILLKNLKNNEISPLDTVIQDLWNVVEQKSQTTRIDTLQKSLRTLLSTEEGEYKPDESKMLVEEEIKEEKILFEQNKLRLYKKKKLLAAEIAELAFEWELNDFAKKAAQFVLTDTWDAKHAIQLIIVQTKCCYFIGQIKIDELVQENFEVPLAGCESVQDEEGVVSEEKKKEVQEKKKVIFKMFARGLELAQSIQQYWLVFNGAIYIWNNFLHIFRNPVRDSQLHPDLSQLLRKFFDAMNNSLKEIEAKGIVYYDLDIKIQTFANIGIMNARLMENSKQVDEVIKICEALLATALSPHTRKLINSIKARVGGGKAPAGKDQKKGGKDAPPEKAGGYNDTFLFQIFSQLEIIQNSTNKTETENLIKKCFESLETWQPKDKDETELELHAQLWARLARLAVNEGNVLMLKYAIRCADYSISLLDSTSLSSIPPNRLRWYSLAEFLYSECLLKISNPETQDVQSYDKLLFGALSHAVEATHKGYKTSINALVVDGAKQVWNICSKLQESQKNRSKLIIPIKTVLYFLKEIKEDGEVDLVLLLAQLFFRAANESNQSKIGEEVADMLFSLVPKNLQKSIWQAKMVFMSKQGKNELQAISNMKEADPSLQAKLWIKLARISVNPKKQYAAYNKAIDILKKENSVEIVEALMEYAEWQLRVGNEKIKNVSSNLLLASDYLIDIEYGDQDEEEEEEGDEDRGTVFSRSTRGKKSHTSKSMKSSMKENKSKKQSEKKGPSSNKSKAGSSGSRMNRSGRVAKTTKSKNAKSIFSQREEDPNPETLNCIHFERLFRIHTMLAMISDTVSNRIRYALDAKQFLVKMLEISFNTLNEIQQNSLKFSDKGPKPESVAKYRLPVTLEGWATLQLGKEFTDRVKSLEDPNFMGTYAFEKPELTFTYMRHLIKIFTSYGLNFHSIPVLCLQKIFAAEILASPTFSQVAELEMTLCLRRIGFTSEEKQNLTKIDSAKYILTESEKKAEKAKTQSKLVEDKSEDNIFQNSMPANLIKPFSNHQAWHQIGKLLIEFGEIFSAKAYLKEALYHYRILGSSEAAGQCSIQLLRVAACEGENQEAMEYAVSANKMCKGIENWEKLLFHSCQLMLRLKKYEDIESFASKIYETVVDLVNGLHKENSEKLMFESEIIELKDILILVQLIDLQVRFAESTHENLTNSSSVILKAINEIDQRLNDEGLWKLRHYQLFFKVASEIVDYFIFGKDKSGHVSRAVFDRIFALILKIEKKLFELMKYTLVGSGLHFHQNQLIATYRQYRFLIASAYTYQAVLEEDGDLPSELDEEEKDFMEMGNVEDNEHLKKFMKTLNKEIHEKMKPVPTTLPPIESSISVLSNLKSSINSNYELVEWKVLNIRSLTIKARLAKQLDDVWTAESAEEESEEEEKIHATASLNAILQFRDKKLEQKLLDYSRYARSYEISQLAYQSFVENYGTHFPSEGFGFEYLSKLQHSSYNLKVSSILRDNLGPTHRLNSFLQLIEEVQLEPAEIDRVLQTNMIFKAWSRFPTYEQCLALMPRNSIYVILQLSLDHSSLYCGFMINEKVEEEYQRRWVMKKAKIEKSELLNYLTLRTKMQKVRKEIAFLAYSDQQKLKDVIEEKEQTLADICNKLDLMSQWWLADLNEILNSVKESSQPAEVDKNKKVSKDTKKKGGKDEVAAYESPLGATPAGFQSITFLLDDFFEGLPFDQLSGMQKVPAISFDSSIFYLSRKMEAIGFKPDANNSNGFGLDKAKYVSYDFKDPEVSFKALSTAITAKNPAVKFDGLASTTRIPSIGDYSRWLSDNGFLQVYGPIDFLNYMKVPLMLENAGTNKAKLLILTDRLNYKKSLINKFLTLDENTPPNSIDDESRILNAVVDLLDINMIKNNWTSSTEMNRRAMLGMYQNFAAGYYLGAVTNKAESETEKESEPRRLYEKLMQRIHGCPVLRM